MPLWTKICANTNLPDAQLAAELGADAVGFVFAASRRRVTAEQARAITLALPESVETIGVFDTLDAAEIVDAVKIGRLTGVQLHTVYRPERVRALNEAFEARVKLIQVVKVPVDVSVEAAMVELAAALCDPGLFAVLLDAAKDGVSGGLGMAFSWESAAQGVRAAREWSESRTQASTVPKLLVAGGLNAANVARAITSLQPDGVDVASGVEADAGRKSPEALRAFLRATRGVSKDGAQEHRL